MFNTSDRGSVTAELVVVLPTVILIIALGIGAFSVQLRQMALIASASQIAKAIAREEDMGIIDSMLTELSPEVGFELTEREDSICVLLSETVVIPGMDFEIIELEEQQCVANFGG